MKKILLLLLFLLLASNSFCQNSVWIDTISSGPNQEVQFTVNIANSQPFTAFQLDITLPAVLDYRANSLQLDPARKMDHDITGSIISGNVLRIVAYSLTKKNFNGSNGTVAEFSCIAKTTPGDYSLIPSNIVISDTNNTKLLFDSFNGKYTLLAPAINIGISNINFGNIPLGQTNDQTIPVTNNGNLSLSVSSFSSNSSEMKCLDSSSVVIQPHQTIYRTVRFSPIKKGNKTGAITIKSNDLHDSIKSVVLTGVGFAVNEIHVGSLNGRSGQQGDLTVSINNMEPFTAFEFTLALPSVMKYIFGSAVLLRNTNHLVSVDTINGNNLRVISYSSENKNFTGTSGDVLKLSFSLLGQGGGYSIPVSNAIISDTTNTNIISASYDGNLQIASPYLSLSSSQINYGAVSITDTGKVNITLYNNGNDTLKINSITSNNSYFFINETYPIIILQGNQSNIIVNFHGISKGNYTGQLTINSNDAPRNPSYISLSGSLFIPNTLSVTSETGLVNDTIEVPFTIENLDQFTAFQFDVTLPSQVEFINNSVVLNPARADNHSLSYSVQSNGAIRIIAYSLNQNIFKGNSGEVVRLSVKLNNPQGTFPVTISNLIIGNVQNQNIASGFNNGNIIIKMGLHSTIKVFLQGSFNNGSMNTSMAGIIPLIHPYNASPWAYSGSEFVSAIPGSMVDWVLVELRSDLNTIAGIRSGLLFSNGTIVDTDGINPLFFNGLADGSYYIVIRHRNHLAIMSAIPVTNNSGNLTYDFTTGQDKAYGTNPMKDLGNGAFGMYAGDVNGDGIIKYNGANNDRGLIYSKIGGGSTTSTWSGYNGCDINLDGNVKYNGANNDRGVIYNNLGGGSTTVTLSTQVPTGTMSAVKKTNNNRKEIK